MTLSYTSPIFQQVNSPALDIRRMVSALLTSEGIVTTGDMAVAQRAAGANMSVDIAAGQAYVQGDGITNQGMYYGYNDGVVNLTGFTAAHATLPRIDRVCLRVRDAFHGDAANDLAFVIVTGTATSGATLVNLTGAAAVPASHLLLANILIPATATTVTTANIDTTIRAAATTHASYREITYNEMASNASVSATTEATANTVVSATAFSADGIAAYEVSFFSPRVSMGSSTLNLWLYLDGASIGQIGQMASGLTEVPVSVHRRIVPAAGSRTFSLRASIAGGTNPIIYTGAGGSGLLVPGFIRVVKVT
jgi:hypothetical protein